MTGYYDIILGLIPAALFGISGALYAAGASLTTAVPAGGLIAIALVGHALFVNGPVSISTPEHPAKTTGHPQSAPVNAD